MPAALITDVPTTVVRVLLIFEDGRAYLYRLDNTPSDGLRTGRRAPLAWSDTW